MAQVILENVTKRFGEVTAVSGVNLTIEDGEFTVLVGPSGCGKTTLLRMVAGLEEITGGTISIGDRVVNDLPPKSRDIAMVFQNYALYPHMNVFENMAFALRLRKFSQGEIETRVGEAAKILGIEDLLQRKPRQMSGGQRQRVALGRAIVRKPSVFLFDEPLSNLDAKLRVQMRAELSKLHSQLQTTSLYVTHDQVEAMTMGTKIAIIKKGVLQQDGSPLEIYEKPANQFVAGFIGSPPMNFFDAEVKQEKGAYHIVGEGVKLVMPDHLKPVVGDLNGDSRQFTFGIRPEHLDDAEMVQKTEPGTTLTGKVEVVEPMGSETFVHAFCGGSKIIARVSPYTRAAYGKPLQLAVETQKIYIFDPKSQATLSGAGLSHEK